MATLVIPGAVMVSLHFTVSGQETVNVIGLTGDILPPDTAANLVHDAWTAANGPMGMLPAAVKLTKVKATSLSTADGAIYERTSTAQGAIATGVGALSTSAIVRVGAGTRSRSSKGRLYFGPLPASVLDTDGRSIKPTDLTAISTRFSAFRTAVNQNSVRWAVLSRKLSVATPVENISVASVIGTQRRRLR